MVNANITRNETPPIILIELTTAEKTKLNRAITGYGKLAAAVATTCISEGTIKRAALGAKLKPDTAAKIRSLINS